MIFSTEFRFFFVHRGLSSSFSTGFVFVFKCFFLVFGFILCQKVFFFSKKKKKNDMFFENRFFFPKLFFSPKNCFFCKGFFSKTVFFSRGVSPKRMFFFWEVDVFFSVVFFFRKKKLFFFERIFRCFFQSFF